MSDPWAAAREESEWIDATWVGYAQSVLWFVGGCYVLIGLLCIPLYAGPFLVDPNIPPEVGVPFAIVFSLISLLCGAGFGVFNFVVAWGLGLRAKWAWIATICLGGLYLTSICLPFGAVLLYAMLDENGRKLFLEKRAD